MRINSSFDEHLTKLTIQGIELKTAPGDKLIDVVMKIALEETIQKPMFIQYHNLHGFALARKDESFKQILNNSSIDIIDGTPVVWLLRLMGYKLDIRWRATMLDWIPKLLNQVNKHPLKVFLLGSNEDTITAAFDDISNSYSNIQLQKHHGYFDTRQLGNKKIVGKINEFSPNILLVGMGMPRQEYWVSKHLETLNVNLIVTVGGYFDYIGGNTVTPARWLGPLGLEWLARLLSNPKRLSHRYLIEPWPVVFSIIKEAIKRKYVKR